MRKPLFIYSSSNFYHAVEQELPYLKSILKELCGKRIRRVDRITQLALIGCLQCKSTHKLPEKTGLYLSSIYGSISNTFSVLSDIYQRGQLPRPVEFVNTVGNAACFHIAEQLQLSANSQFVTRDEFTLETAINLASIDLEIGNVEAALVGVVCEVGDNLAIHRQRFQVDPSYSLAEGSHWLYLAHHLGNEDAIATITNVIELIGEDDLEKYLSSIVSEERASLKFGFGSLVRYEQRERLLRKFATKEATYAPKMSRHEFYTALNVCGFLDVCRQRPDLSQFIHIDTDGNKHWSVIALSKCG